MSKRGRKVTFHGAFGSKVKAKRKERQRKHAYIKRVRIRGDTRYVVMTRRGE